MQDSQESLYEGMIVANPNMILNVMVPRTVQKQAEEWQRGTRTHKIEQRLSRKYLVNDEHASEDNADQSCSSGHETDDQSKTTIKITSQAKPRKKSVRQNDPVAKVSGSTEMATPAYDPHDFNTKQNPENNETATYTHSHGYSSCHNDNPLTSNYYLANSSQHRYQQESESLQDPEVYLAQTNLMKRFASFERGHPSSAPLHAFCQDARLRRSFTNVHPGDIASRCTTIDYAAHWEESLQPNHTKQQSNHLHEHVNNTARAAPTISFSSPSRDNVYSTKQPLQGVESSTSCSSAKEGFKRQQTTTPVVMKHSRQTGPERSGMRVHYRQWMDSKITPPSSDLDVQSTHPPQTCSSIDYRRTCSTQDRAETPQQLCAPTWPGPRYHVQFRGPFAANMIDSVTFSRLHHSHNVNVGLCTTAQTPGSDDLMDLSVEETVDFFLKMTSPLGSECRENSENCATIPPSLKSNFLGFRSDTCHY